MKRIFLTGAAGFIGFHLAQHLASRGDAVLGYDNFNDYYTPQLKRERAALLQRAHLPVVEGDLCNLQEMKKQAQAFQATHCVHLAAQAGVRYSLTNPHAYLTSNLEGFLNVLELCRFEQLPLIYASSSSVYGNNKKIPFAETDPVEEQASLYGVTKRSNELMAATYHRLFHFPVTGLRFFTVYGPWGRPDMAYYTFTKAILEERPIDLYFEGKAKRDFTYIDDIVKGITSAIDLSAPCELFNLGNHQPVELLHFVETLEKIIGKKAVIQLKPPQPGDVVTTYADIIHSRKMLQFSPQVPLETGLRHFFAWYAAHAR